MKPKSYRESLTPQMLQYDDFDDRAETRWLPYLMHFHRADYRSAVVNTDRLGFRVSHGDGGQASVGDVPPKRPVRLFAGSSTAFGIGASSDAATIPSRLWTTYAPSAPWLNFAGRSHSSMQELILFLMYRDLLPEIEHIVVLSGVNDLALAKLPAEQRGEHGGFFFCGEYFQLVEALRERHRTRRELAGRGHGRSRRPAPKPARTVRTAAKLFDLVDIASDLTARHLEALSHLAGPRGARVTFVLQPLANWWQTRPHENEHLLFDELELTSTAGPFSKNYGLIATPQAHRLYTEALAAACAKIDVEFLDLNPLLAEAAGPDDWIYVDRAHFNDHGHDLTSRLLAQALRLT